MTLYLKPDYDLSFQTRAEYKRAVARLLRQKAPAVLNTGAVDIREAVVGGSAVTNAQTSLPVNEFGSAVDLSIITITATTGVGWNEIASGITANTLSEIIATATQPNTAQNKLYAIYGVQDFTPNGDLYALRFASGNNVKGFVETEAMYESNEGDFIGGMFVDDQTDDLGVVFYGMRPKEPLSIKGLWGSSANKYVKLRMLIAEVAGTVVTQAGAQTVSS